MDNDVFNGQNIKKFSDFSIEEYLDLFSKQYFLETSKKQSLESRSGIILSFVVAFSIMLFDKVNLKFINSTDSVMIFAVFMRLILCFVCYIFDFLSILYSALNILTLGIKHLNIDIYSNTYLSREKIDGLVDIFNTYKDLIKDYRRVNGIKAKRLNKSVLFLILCVIIFCIYINLF